MWHIRTFDDWLFAALRLHWSGSVCRRWATLAVALSAGNASPQSGQRLHYADRKPRWLDEHRSQRCADDRGADVPE
jgi:hypothetical protein